MSDVAPVDRSEKLYQLKTKLSFFDFKFPFQRQATYLHHLESIRVAFDIFQDVQAKP